MHSESEIKKSIKILLEAYGQLNTSEVKQHLHEVLVFDSDDLLPSTSRNGEIRILQRIGNVVSHQPYDVALYEEGFLVDKNFEPAVWVLTMGNSGNEQPISPERIEQLRNKLNEYSPNRYKKINWDEVNERNSSLGLSGEEFVYQMEIDNVMQCNPDVINKVQHLSAHQGDGFGYDILSVDEFGNSKYIEVKTTKSHNPMTPFYMSINERHFFEENIDNNAFVYRVYDFDMQSRHGNVIVISARQLLEEFDFEPISFRVTPRG